MDDHIQLPESNQLEFFIEQARLAPAIETVVVHPTEGNALAGALEAAKQGLIIPILVGPEVKIRLAATAIGESLENVKIINTEHSHEAAEVACNLVKQGHARALMKGSLNTSELLSAVLNKETGIRTARRLSHLFVLDVPNYHKPLIITDAAINITPDLNTKRDIIQNAIDFAHALGNKTPKVAVLAAVETVKANMQSTLDAAALCKMADRGQITGAIIDGPLAFDNAISSQAAIDKHIVSAVSGEADILLAPDLEAGNMMAKQLIYLAGAASAGIAVGSKVPIILNSRADSITARLASCALASYRVHHGQPI